jgi:hypothetical protein
MVNDSPRVPRRRRRRAGPRKAHATAAIIVTAGLALLAAACGSPSPAGSGGSPHAGGSSNPPSTTSEKLLAFSACMRSQGVPAFPDPDSSGRLPEREIAQLLASNPQFPAAHRTCEHLLPNGGQPSQVQVQQAWNDMRNFAHCMRSHGVPSWPDPAPTSQQDQRPFFHLPDSIDPTAPQITAKVRVCQHVFHASNPLVTTQ